MAFEHGNAVQTDARANIGKTALGGLLAGAVNGLLGAGGGMVLLPLLSREMGTTGKDGAARVHAACLVTMLLLSGVSALLYALDGRFEWELLWRYLPGGILGGVAGAFLLTKMPPMLLRRLFGGLAVIAGIRLFLR